MSSFKRKGTSKPTTVALAGTRISPASHLTLITSTGIASLDDILGGGLPLSCSLVFAAPDIHSSYGDLIQKYFIAQGLAVGQRVCVVSPAGREFVNDVMWYAKGQMSAKAESEDEEGESGKVKIAWRYEKMKTFETTVGSGVQGDAYCRNFELTSRIPEEVVREEVAKDRLHFVDVEPGRTVGEILDEIGKYVESDASVPVRVCIPGLGSASWGGLTGQEILYFLYSLRGKLREQVHGCASTTLPPELSERDSGGWLERVGWMSDGLVGMCGFSGDPALCAAFPGHHGLVEMHRLPSPHTGSAASERFSQLRGLGRGGENNLAFRCTRKRLVVETLHLDAAPESGPSVDKASKSKQKQKRVGFANDEMY